MIYEVKNYTQDGREIQALIPQDASQPVKYFGRGWTFWKRAAS